MMLYPSYSTSISVDRTAVRTFAFAMLLCFMPVILCERWPLGSPRASAQDDGGPPVVPAEIDDLLKSMIGDTADATSAPQADAAEATSPELQPGTSPQPSRDGSSIEQAIGEVMSEAAGDPPGIPDPFSDSPSSSSADVSETSPASKRGERIELLSGYDAAVRMAKIEQRPILVVLGAEWCSWCRKLEGELATPAADSILKQWIVVKVDVDEEPEIAQKLSAGALPALRVLALDQSLIASSEGYQPMPELEAWLTEQRAKADPAVQRILYESGNVTPAQIEELVAFLGDRNPNFRAAARGRLLTSRFAAASRIVDTLRTGTLAQQLSAVELLTLWGAPVDGLDPWQPDSLAEPTVTPLLDWLQTLDAEEQEVAPDSEARMVVPEELQEAIAQLLKADVPLRRNGALLEATRLGEALLPELRQLLQNSEGLSESQVELLREALYRGLAGAKTRLDRAPLLNALSSLGAETHRDAADEFLANATSADQQLVDELSSDSDPLIREMAVMRLQAIGALQDRQRFERLLNDPSPSVRTAVLRAIEDDPDEKLVKALVAYLQKETDEDLLVYATKTLGGIGEQTEAEAELIRLAANPAWRVRAAALDSIKTLCEAATRTDFHWGGTSSASQVSRPVALCILEATNDQDAFVNSKAMALLPYAITKSAAAEMCKFLAAHPDQLAQLTKEMSEYEIPSRLQPLIDQSKKWLQESDPDERRIAVMILAKYQPNDLQKRLPELIADDDPATRVAALQGTIASLNLYRDERIEKAGSTISRYVADKAEPLTAWHPVADWFQPLPASPVRSESTEELDDHFAETNSSPSLFGGLFEMLLGGEPAMVAEDDDAADADQGSAESSAASVVAEWNATDDATTTQQTDGAADFLALLGESAVQPLPETAAPPEDTATLEEPGESLDLEAVDNFFGDVTNDLPPATNAVSLREEATSDSLLEVDELLGALTAGGTVESSDGEEQGNLAVTTAETTAETGAENLTLATDEDLTEQADSKDLSLPSRWLEHWQQPTTGKPAWVSQSNAKVDERRKLLASLNAGNPSDIAERRWIDAVRLAFGDVEPELVDAVTQDAMERVPSAAVDSDAAAELANTEPADGEMAVANMVEPADVLPWLPSAARHQLLLQLPIDWAAPNSEPTSTWLMAATDIDDREVAATLLREFGEVETRDVEQLLVYRILLLRSLLGSSADDTGQWIDSSDFHGKESFWDDDQADLPGERAALEWLGERYAAETRSQARVVLMLAVNALDHRLATESAVGLLTGLKENPELAAEFEIKVALQLALTDAKELAADRAVQLLDIPNETVQAAAIQRLLLCGEEYASESQLSGIERIYNYQDDAPGLSYVRRTIEPATLERLRGSDNKSHRSFEDLIALSQGDMTIDPHELEEALSVDDPYLLVTVALTKAKRTDAKALIYYRSITKWLEQIKDDDLESAARFYQLLRGLDGPEIATLRSDMRKTFGNELLSL